MPRKFFNSISAIDFDGKQISFSFIDKTGSNNSKAVEVLDTYVTDLDTFVGITDFLLAQKNAILQDMKNNGSDYNNEDVTTPTKEIKYILGKKLPVSSSHL